MEHPAQEIKDVILALCTRSPAEQEEALGKYFLPDAEFVHPLCRVPSFGRDAVRRYLPGPLSRVAQRAGGAGDLDSRRLIGAIFRWYRILSPHIALGVESVAFDRASDTLFVALHQRFALWFVPFYAAHVRLITELKLVPVLEGDGRNSYAAVAASHAGSGGGSTVAAAANAPNAPNTSRGRLVNGETHPHPPQTRYYISRQEDHYQVNELLKFFALGLGPWLWALVQVFATLVCVGGVLVVDTTRLGLFRRKKGGKK